MTVDRYYVASGADYEAAWAPESGERERLLPRQDGSLPPAVFGSGAARLRLHRTWEPLSPRWREPSNASLGIGIISCNRLDRVRWLVEALQSHTHTPFHLVIADDGSVDGTAAWARESGIPVVTGRNRGVAWNKNRALYWLMHRTSCEKLLLIEDDIHPVRDGWERGWLEALDCFGHLNYCPDSGRPEGGQQVAVYDPYPAFDWVNGLMMAFTRPAVEQVGYLDTRFQGYGAGHVEYTERFRRAGLHPPRGFVTLRDGSLSEHPRQPLQESRVADIARNRALRRELAQDPVWRPPARGSREAAILVHEQERARWSQKLPVGEGAEIVSVLCASRTEALARRMAASFSNDPNIEFLWAWNGEGMPDLPGRVLDYPGRPFNYCEAYNWVARHARGKVLLMVNDDVELTCTGLPRFLLDLYRSRPDLGVAYGGQAGTWEVHDAPEAPHWQGCCWAISRSAFAAMGGLEESLHGYGADEFVTTIRMLRLGYAGARINGWTYRHEAHKSYGQVEGLRYNRREVPAALGWGVATELSDLDLGWNGPWLHQQIATAEGRGDLADAWLPNVFKSAASEPLSLADTTLSVAGDTAHYSADAVTAGNTAGHPLPSIGYTLGIAPANGPHVASPAIAKGMGERSEQFLTARHEPVSPSTPLGSSRLGAASGPSPKPFDRIPLSPWFEPARAPLGIGIISCNRLAQVRRLVEALQNHTFTPFHLVIADDGSVDGTAAWARESGIPVMTGRNRGVAWNKNRALYWLMHRTSCEKLLLIEDDIHPVRDGWERGWLEALERFGHLCYSPEGAHVPEQLVALHFGYVALDWVGGALMAMTRKTVERVGYLDTRFQGYGDEHIEYSERCQRAGYYSHPGFVTLRDGSLCDHPPIEGSPERLRDLLRNRKLRARLVEEPVYRPPARDEPERQVLETEIEAAIALRELAWV